MRKTIDLGSSRRQIWLGGTALAGWLIVSGCHLQPKGPAENNYQAAARDLDIGEATVNKWGKLTSSEIYLAKDSGQLSFAYNATDNSYVDEARKKLEGGATSIEVTREGLALSGQVGLQPNIAPGQPANGNSPAAPDRPGSPIGNVTLATPGNLTISPPHLPLRFGLVQGFNDKVMADVLKLLSNPKPTGDQEIYIGMLQVSCEPGMLTRQGYIGELDFTLDYAKERTIPAKTTAGLAASGINLAGDGMDLTDEQLTKFSQMFENLDLDEPGKMKITAVTPHDGQNATSGQNATNDFGIKSVVNRPGNAAVAARGFATAFEENGPNPGVLAVLPLIDTQVLDLQNLRDQYSRFSLDLAVAFLAQGMTVQAKAAYEFSRQIQEQRRTLSALPVVTSFSNGHHFGFRFYPSLQALTDPGSIKGRDAGNVLQPTTFPAIIVVLVDKKERMNSDGPWTHYAFNVTPHWRPLNNWSEVFDNGAAVRLARAYDIAWQKYEKGNGAPNPVAGVMTEALGEISSEWNRTQNQLIAANLTVQQQRKWVEGQIADKEVGANGTLAEKGKTNIAAVAEAYEQSREALEKFAATTKFYSDLVEANAEKLPEAHKVATATLKEQVKRAAKDAQAAGAQVQGLAKKFPQDEQEVVKGLTEIAKNASALKAAFGLVAEQIEKAQTALNQADAKPSQLATVRATQAIIEAAYGPTRDNFFQKSYVGRELSFAPFQLLGFTRYAKWPGAEEPAPLKITTISPNPLILSENPAQLTIALSDNQVKEWSLSLSGDFNGKATFESKTLGATVLVTVSGISVDAGKVAKGSLVLDGNNAEGKSVKLKSDLILMQAVPKTPGLTITRNAQGQVTEVQLRKEDGWSESTENLLKALQNVLPAGADKDKPTERAATGGGSSSAAPTGNITGTISGNISMRP